MDSPIVKTSNKVDGSNLHVTPQKGRNTFGGIILKFDGYDCRREGFKIDCISNVSQFPLLKFPVVVNSLKLIENFLQKRNFTLGTCHIFQIQKHL